MNQTNESNDETTGNPRAADASARRKGARAGVMTAALVLAVPCLSACSRDGVDEAAAPAKPADDAAAEPALPMAGAPAMPSSAAPDDDFRMPESAWTSVRLPPQLASATDFRPFPDGPLPPGPLPDERFDAWAPQPGWMAFQHVALPAPETMPTMRARVLASLEPSGTAAMASAWRGETAAAPFYADLVRDVARHAGRLAEPEPMRGPVALARVDDRSAIGAARPFYAELVAAAWSRRDEPGADLPILPIPKQLTQRVLERAWTTLFAQEAPATPKARPAAGMVAHRTLDAEPFTLAGRSETRAVASDGLARWSAPVRGDVRDEPAVASARVAAHRLAGIVGERSHTAALAVTAAEPGDVRIYPVDLSDLAMPVAAIDPRPDGAYAMGVSRGAGFAAPAQAGQRMVVRQALAEATEPPVSTDDGTAQPMRADGWTMAGTSFVDGADEPADGPALHDAPLQLALDDALSPLDAQVAARDAEAWMCDEQTPVVAFAWSTSTYYRSQASGAMASDLYGTMNLARQASAAGHRWASPEGASGTRCHDRFTYHLAAIR